MMHEAGSSIEEVPYCFSRLSTNFKGTRVEKIDDLNPIWDYYSTSRPVAAIKSPRFALFYFIYVDCFSTDML